VKSKLANPATGLPESAGGVHVPTAPLVAAAASASASEPEVQLVSVVPEPTTTSVDELGVARPVSISERDDVASESTVTVCAYCNHETAIENPTDSSLGSSLQTVQVCPSCGSELWALV
jgi:hypothetical protein